VCAVQIDFKSSEGPSLGVEMELQLVDVHTRELVSGASPILERMGAAHPGGVHPKAKHELFESTIEMITGVCTTVAEARADLAATLDELRRHAEADELALLCSGTHPSSHWADQQVTPDPRYAKLVEEMQWLARRLQIFGIHVHVGIRSAEKAIAIANAAAAYIPHLLAISASSPYWTGFDTGLASSRSKVFEGLPTAGLPYQLSGWDQFEQLMTTLVCSKAISSIREVWWDIRPHPDFGTVELRICDGTPRLAEVASVAALSQCLVHWLDARLDAGEVLELPMSWTVRENKWKAARYGIDAELIVDEAGTLRPLRDEVVALVETLAPVARQLGCADELHHTLTMLDVGPSYARQRAMVAGGASLMQVVDSLIDELRTDQTTVEVARA
jgi:glutamate---cysteine ligase / carboxylate-amine ligase